MPSKRLGRFLSNRRVQVVLGAAAALLLLYFLLDNIVMPLYTRQGSERPVPKLIGLSEDQARSVVQSLGFSMVEEPGKPGLGVDEGTIIEQHPLAGSMSKPGRKIHVVPALAAVAGEVPNLVGLELRDAQLRVKNVGLISGEADLRYKFSDKSPKGTIVAQDPAPGKPAATGGTVKLTVSMGPQPEHFYVPYLMEMPLTEARTLLLESGLRLGRITRKETDSQQQGTVIGQTIASGTEVTKGAAIDVVVAVRVHGYSPADSSARAGTSAPSQ
jgi:beta-lactam-binding protein with PASTA domain